MRWLIQKLEFRNLSPASCKGASFPLVLDLMHEYYVISFPYVFHFLIWKRPCFVVHFHIFSQKLQGNGIGILFFTLRTRENNEKLKLSSTNKTRFFFVSNFWWGCMQQPKKSKFLCAIFRILIHSDPKTLQISFYSRFKCKNLVGKCD